VAATGTSDAPAKCPTCRCEFQMSDITLDADLKERIQRANTVTCQYEGCNAQLSLNQVAIHEQTCLFVPIKCRYASFGCEWKGTRQTLVEHEATCSLMQVSNLVEQFRQTRADHGHALNHLQTRVCIHELRDVLLHFDLANCCYSLDLCTGCRVECNDGAARIPSSTTSNAKLPSW
jgi:hypothetical protein